VTLPHIHPEHLIDRVLAGTASDVERAELEAHVRGCAGCAAELQLSRVLRQDDDDHASVSASVDAVLATLVREGRIGVPAAPAEPAEPRRAWLPWAMAACVFFTGSAAAATLIVAVRVNERAPSPAQPPPATAPRPPAQPKQTIERAQEPADVQPAAEPAAPVPVRVDRARPHTPARPLPDADELFAQAREASMRGEHGAAAELYTTLEQRFAQSDQAHVARVLLGRLYLERLGDARAALDQFDAYLKQGGANRPEALLGRARALRKLGRGREEIETLRELVDAYPDSLYVAPARERLRSAQ
jgi:TolA-binding protein